MSAAAKPESTAVARIEPAAKPAVLRTEMGKILTTERADAMLAPLVPRGLDFNVVIAEAYRQSIEKPEILKCTAASIISAIAVVLQTQLVIGKTIHLVPVNTKVKDDAGNTKYEDRLQAWNDYKGDIELVIRSGAARHVDGQVVYEGDIFEPTLGTAPDITHRPTIDPKKRGKVLGAYAIAYLNGSGSLRKVEWLPLSDVEKVRAKSRGWKDAPECPPWYAIKTAIHRVCKTLPKNEKLAKVLAIMDRQHDEDMVDAEITDGDTPLDPSKRIEASGASGQSEPAGESYELRAPTRATPEQKARIASLLDRADVDDATRERIAGAAGRKDYAAADAEAQIAALEKLVPAGEFDLTSEG